MVALGILVGLWLYRRELAYDGVPHSALDAAMVGIVGGLVGAKLLWVAEHLGEGPLSALVLSRGGMSWFGGFAGGIGAGIWMLRWRAVPILAALAAATPALTVGHALGRIGCFLVGDDYGGPSGLPWAVAFPNGLPPTTVPVHPTQIYEALALVPLTRWLLRWRRAGRSPARVLGLYLAGAGAARFTIEFLRVNARVIGELSVAHVAALATCAVGVALLARTRTGDDVRHDQPSPNALQRQGPV
jgi:phosphatidylglycerol:prolipoprotein diacylglycerol transferase